MNQKILSLVGCILGIITLILGITTFEWAWGEIGVLLEQV